MKKTEYCWQKDGYTLRIPRAIRAYEKAGFRQEGVRREAAPDRTGYGDDVLMAILEDEWREIKQTEQIEERTVCL